MRFCNCSKSRLAQAGKKASPSIGFPRSRSLSLLSRSLCRRITPGARFRGVRQEVRPPPGGWERPFLGLENWQDPGHSNATVESRQLEILPNQSASEHSTQSDKSHTEHTQSSRFRNSKRSAPHLDVPDSLSELPVNGVDVLNSRAAHHTTVIEHALDGAAEGKGEVFGSRRASQSPHNRTDEAAIEDRPLRLSIISPANHDKR